MESSMPDWLESLRKELVEITSPVAQELWPSGNRFKPVYFNYRIEHVKQVERDALILWKELGGDLDIILAAVWIHDRFQPAFTGDDHGQLAAEWASQNLEARGFPSDKLEDLCFAVANHSNAPHTLPTKPVEARILWDADKLAHLGSFEVLVLILNSLATDMIERMQNDTEYEGFTYTAKYFFQKRMQRLDEDISVAEKFYHPVSRQIALERLEVQKAFFRCLKNQVQTDIVF